MKTYQSTEKNIYLILNHKTSKKVLISQVILLKGDVNYTTFHFDNGKTKVVSHTIKFFEEHLQTHGFLRVHRGFMINPNHVKEYNPEQEFLTMSNGQKAQISRRKKAVLRNFDCQ